MKNGILKNYGIILMVLGAVNLLGIFSYWRYSTWRVIDWIVVIACGYIGYQIFKHSDVKE